MARLIAPRERPSHVLLPLPSGNVARIPIEDTDSFDMEEAKLFEDTARHKGDEVTLAMLETLQAKGLGKVQAVATVCEYRNALKQDAEDAAEGK